MRKQSNQVSRSGNRAARKLCCRLSGFFRTAVLGTACVWGLLNTGQLNIAYAVDHDGAFLAYVESREELSAVVDGVQRSVSSALGHEWDAPSLHTRFTLGKSDVVSCDADAVEDWLYELVSDVRTLTLVYVNGRAVCAFETAAEAAEALRALSAEYLTGKAETASFAETISVASGKAEVSLLEGNRAALRDAVTVETTCHVTVEKSLPYETRLVVNKSMYQDESYIDTYGCDGVLVTEYLVTSHNRVMTDYVETGCTRHEPVTQVVVVGGRARLSTGSYIWPVEKAYISSDFGRRSSTIGSANHQGIDLAYDYGTSIYAADGGVVTFAGERSGYGKLVTIEHDNGDVTWYAHCKKLLVSEGDIVKQGEEIALMGSTGNSTGSHLHFEIHPGGGKAVNPTTMLPACDFVHIDC